MSSKEWLQLAKEAQKEGLLEQALEYYGQALQECLGAYGEFHPEVSFIYNYIGGIYFKQKDYLQAGQYIQLALKGFHRVCNADHPLLAQTYNNLGLAMTAKGEYDEAIQCFERALQIAGRAGMEELRAAVEKRIDSLFARMRPQKAIV